jgi:hypothetical protein
VEGNETEPAQKKDGMNAINPQISQETGESFGQHHRNFPYPQAYTQDDKTKRLQSMTI